MLLLRIWQTKRRQYPANPRESSVHLHPPTDTTTPSSPSRQALNGSSITKYGTRSLTMMNIRLCRTFRWIFVITDIENPILGADFLCHLALLVDVKHIISSTLQLNFTPTLIVSPLLSEPSSLVGLLALLPLQPSSQTEDASLSLNSSLTSCTSSVPNAST